VLRTPSWAYGLISWPMLRAVCGWDLPDRDVRRWVPAVSVGMVVEVGAGGGFYTAALRRHLGPGVRLVAVDLPAAQVARLRARLGVAGVSGDGQRLPLRDGSVDVLFYGYALEELPDPHVAVSEAARVLRPGGQLVLFLWRPLLTGGRRGRLFAALERDFVLLRGADGPQNLRRAYRRRGPGQGSA